MFCRPTQLRRHEVQPSLGLLILFTIVTRQRLGMVESNRCELLTW